MKLSKDRRVKGSVIIDYLKIIRANPDLPWAEHLTPSDLEQLDQMILPSSWYPIDLFERIGIAIFKLVSKDNYDIVHSFGRMVGERINTENPGLVVPDRPNDTLNKYLVIQDRLYSFKFIEKGDSSPGQTIVHIHSEPEDQGAPLLISSTSGTIERLIELSGARNIKFNLIESVAKGADKNSLEVTWEK